MATVIKEELDFEEDVKVDIKEEVLLSDQIVLLDFQDCVMKRESSIKCEGVDLQDDSQPQASCNDQFRRHTEGTVEPHEGRVEHDYVIKHEVLDCGVISVKYEPIDRHNDYQSQAPCNGHLVTHTEDSKERHTSKAVCAAESEDENTEVRKEQLKRAALKSKLRVCFTRLEAQQLTRYYSEQRSRENWPCVRYSCDVCKGTFSHKSTLRQHCQGCQCDTVKGRRIERRGAYECGVCGMAFMRKSRLKEHVIAHTDSDLDVKYEPDEFGVFVAPSRVDTGSPAEKALPCHVCSVCNEQPNQTAHTPSEISCLVCKQPMLCINIGRHLRQHGLYRIVYCCHCQQYCWNFVKKRQLLFKCDHCDKQYRSKWALKEHALGHTTDDSFIYITCKKVFVTQRSLNAHFVNHSKEKAYSCEICGKAFKTKNWVNYHFSYVHSNHRPFSCKLCIKRFKSISAVRRHQICHNRVPVATCDICGRQFVRRSELELHIQIQHSVREDFLCDICSKSFKRLVSLKNHILTHCKEKLFQCKVCLQSFKSHVTLDRHVSVHSGDKKHCCEKCKKTFRTESNLQQHMRCHSEVRKHCCLICDKKFKLPHQLRAHMISHSGARPHGCEVCPKRFMSYGALSHHRKSHKNAAQCAYCYKLFTKKAVLKEHILEKHIGGNKIGPGPS